jgi:ATP-dependent DNA ligase
MLARTGPIPVGDGWALEVKFDGMRLQLRSDGRAVCVRSRPGRECTEEFPELAPIRSALGRHRVLLNGELVCLAADGSPDFASLRRRLRAPADKARRHAERSPVTYQAFDLLHLDGRSTRDLPYEGRRKLLFDLGLDAAGWRTPRHFVGESEGVLAATRAHGLEGVVAKRLGSRYLPAARNGAWVKHKHRRTESFLVTGWCPPEPRRPESLLLARVGSDETLEPAGSVPLVIANGQADDVRGQLKPLVLPPTRRGQRIRAWRRRCGRSSPSTAHPEGPCAIRFSAPSLRSSCRARRRLVLCAPVDPAGERLPGAAEAARGEWGRERFGRRQPGRRAGRVAGGGQRPGAASSSLASGGGLSSRPARASQRATARS